MSVELSELDAFVAVAEARSFRGAAALRGVSPSTLSDTLRRLEARLGVRLLNRTTRSVTPTEAGERLLERLRPALAAVTGALDALDAFREGPRGTLRLNAPGIVAQKILPPIACRFLAAHRGVKLEVVADDSFIDVLAAGFDAGVRYEERIERDMIAIPLGPRAQRFVLAGAPSYFAARGRPQHPRDLLDHACIRHRFANGHAPAWEFEREGVTQRVSPEGPLVANAAELELAAAVSGLGLVYAFEEFLRPALDGGALVEALPEWSVSFSGPWLYYASRAHMPGPLRAFVDFLKAEAER